MTISRKKRPLDRKIPHKRDTRLFIIATEGKETEKQFFELFRNPRIQVHVLNTRDCKSAPEYVCERLSKFKKEYELNSDDELWLMVDVDRWGDKKLAEITQFALQRKFNLAISNPCFEIWLYLHFAPLGTISTKLKKCKDIVTHLEKYIPDYNKSKLNIALFSDRVQEAIARAKEADTDSDARWPLHPGTHVYKVVEKLLKSN